MTYSHSEDGAAGMPPLYIMQQCDRRSTVVSEWIFLQYNSTSDSFVYPHCRTATRPKESVAGSHLFDFKLISIYVNTSASGWASSYVFSFSPSWVMATPPARCRQSTATCKMSPVQSSCPSQFSTISTIVHYAAM